MIDTAAAASGQEGVEIKEDLNAYVDGVNAYIADVRGNPLAEPGEYAAARPAAARTGSPPTRRRSPR